MPGWVASMSRSNLPSGNGRRKLRADKALLPLQLDETATQRARGNKTPRTRHAPVNEPDVMQEIMVDIDTMLDKQAAQDSPDNGIARRRIEMLREAQWLQRQLAESYDP